MAKPSTSISGGASIHQLPIELLDKVFRECDTVQDVLALAQTSHRFYCAWVGADQATILLPIVRSQFSPLRDVVQLVMFQDEVDNADMHIVLRDSSRRQALLDKLMAPQHPHMTRSLLRRVVAAGMVAQQWAEIYPQERWREDYHHRRRLNAREAHRVRRAVYRRWLYDLAFHNPAALEFFHGSSTTQIQFLDQFPSRELLEIAELNNILSYWLANDICPSSQTVRTQYEEIMHDACPRDAVHPFRPLPPSARACVPISKKVLDEGWGNAPDSQEALGSLLRLPPDALLHLRLHTARKAERLAFLRARRFWARREPSSLVPCIAAVPKIRWIRDLVYMRPGLGHADGGVVDYRDVAYPPWTGETADPPLDPIPVE